MKKKYKYKLPKSIYILATIFIVLFLSFSIFNLLRLLKVNDMISTNPNMDIFALCFSLFIMTLILLVLFNSSYIIDKELICVFGFISKKINYQNILLIQYQEKTDILIIFYLIPPAFSYENVQYIRINIDKKYIDDFIKDLRDNNTAIKYELLRGENEKNNYSEQ